MSFSEIFSRGEPRSREASIHSWRKAQAREIDVTKNRLDQFCEEMTNNSPEKKCDGKDDLATRLKGLERLEELGLPYYNNAITTVGEFLDNPQVYIDQVNNRGESFYPKIIKKSGRRVYQLATKKENLVDFVTEHMKRKLGKKKFRASREDTFVLSEFFKNIYGGSFVIHDDGYVVMELCRGNHSKIAHGQVSPLLTGVSDPNTGSMRYEKRADSELAESLGKKRTIFNLFGEKKLPFPAWTDEEFEEVKALVANALLNFPKHKLEEPNNFSRYSPFSARTPDDEDGNREVPVSGYFDFVLTKIPRTINLENDDKDQPETEPKYDLVFIDSRDVDMYRIR